MKGRHFFPDPNIRLAIATEPAPQQLTIDLAKGRTGAPTQTSDRNDAITKPSLPESCGWCLRLVLVVQVVTVVGVGVPHGAYVFW